MTARYGEGANDNAVVTHSSASYYRRGANNENTGVASIYNGRWRNVSAMAQVFRSGWNVRGDSIYQCANAVMALLGNIRQPTSTPLPYTINWNRNRDDDTEE